MQGKAKGLLSLAVVLGSVGLLMVLLRPVSASHLTQGIWTHAMPACAIDELTAGRYTASTVSVQHLFVTTGLIRFRCNVENLPIAPDTTRLVLELVYQDQDGPGTSYSVLAELFQLTDSGLPIVRATVNSDDFPASLDLQTQHTTFSHDFDFLHNSYFVEVSIFRANAEQVPAAATVRIRRLLVDEQ